jgi:hypothetical protein
MFANGTASGKPPEKTAEAEDESKMTGDDVSEQQGQTRSEVAGAVESLNSADILHRVNAIMQKMENLRSRMKDVESIAATHLKGKEWQEWKDTETHLTLEGEEVKDMHYAAKQIEAWKNGELPPLELRAFLTDCGFLNTVQLATKQEEADNSKSQVLHALDESMANLQSSSTPFSRDTKSAWETRNYSDKLTVVQSIEDQKIQNEDNDGKNSTLKNYLDLILKDIDSKTQAWDAALKTTNLGKFLDDFDKEAQLKEGKGGEGFLNTIRGLPSAVGMKFYSIEEIILAGKSVIDAYKESYRQKQQLNAAGLSKQMGKLIHWLPWAGDVQQILDKELDAKNDEVKSKYAEYLKNRNASYFELFGPKGELVKNMKDGNRARGVLEYASHRGWLYDIDLHTQAADGHDGFTLTDGTIISFWDLVPKDWDDIRTKDEFSKLITEQGIGKDAETEKYYKRYYNVNDTPQFVELVDQEMEKLNLWAVRGIVKRSIERGLTAEVTSWHATQIMDHIRSSQELRRIATKDWYDQMGTLAFYRTSFTLGGFKLDRDRMKEWREEWKDVEGDARIEDAGVLGRIISQLERDISQRTRRTWKNDEERKELRRYIGQILGAQTITIEGQTFSIFEDRYSWYRNSGLIKNQGDPHPGVDTEDPDYFTQVTDNLLAGQRPVTAILARTGQGTWKESEKASHYIGNILYTYDNLVKNGKMEEAENFRKDMGQKVSATMMEQALGDNRTSAMVDLITKGAKPGQPALKALVLSGFFDIEPIVQTIWDDAPQTGTGLAIRVLRSIDDSLYDRLKDLMEKNKKATADQKTANLKEYNTIMQEWKKKQPSITWSQGYLKGSRRG